jgi:gliding motility-associated-like protein
MNEHHPIDDLFRETISEVELSPSDKVWSSLDEKLGQKSRAAKKGKYLLSSAVVTGALLIAGYYFLSSKDTAPVSAEKHIAQKAIETSPVITEARQPEPEKTQTIVQHHTTAVSKKENTTANTISVTKTEDKIAASNTESAQEQTRKEQVVKNEVNPVVVNKETPTKKEITDKDIKLVPSYPAEQSQQRTAANPPTKPVVKNDATDTPPAKNEAAATTTPENVIYVPNAFTPNGDGLNDVFLPKAAEEPKEYKLYIFDPNGNMIFYSDDFSKGWDGKVTHNGIEATKEGLYMWKMEIRNSKGEKEVRMGYVNLLK